MAAGRSRKKGLTVDTAPMPAPATSLCAASAASPARKASSGGYKPQSLEECKQEVVTMVEPGFDALMQPATTDSAGKNCTETSAAEVRSHGSDSDGKNFTETSAAEVRSHITETCADECAHECIRRITETCADECATALSEEAETQDADESMTTSKRKRPSLVRAFQSAPPAIIVDEPADGEASAPSTPPELTFPGRRPKSMNLMLMTPSSCSSSVVAQQLTPGTPQPDRQDLKLIAGDVGAILFDFDGTLTASPGERAQRCQKEVELCERAPFLAPRLQVLRRAGIVLGVISKSSEATIMRSLQAAGMHDLFDGPVLAKAVGLEGKAGFIEQVCSQGALRHLGASGWHRVMLVDDDLRELDRARGRGIQTYAAPECGGLQCEDFDEIFGSLNLPVFSTIPPLPDNTFLEPVEVRADVKVDAEQLGLESPLLA